MDAGGFDEGEGSKNVNDKVDQSNLVRPLDNIKQVLKTSKTGLLLGSWRRRRRRREER